MYPAQNISISRKGLKARAKMTPAERQSFQLLGFDTRFYNVQVLNISPENLMLPLWTVQ